MMVRRVARHICQVAHFCSDNPGMDERGPWLLRRPVSQLLYLSIYFLKRPAHDVL
jgi:hypothetical protein